VVINGPGIFNQALNNGTLTLHQYNTRAPLVINALTHDGGITGVVKTGPGEAVLTHPGNNFRSLFVLEGTLIFDSIASNGTTSAAGNGVAGQNPITLGDATFRYAGTNETGHATDRLIRLRESGTVDASGAGPLVFTAPVNFSPYSYGLNRMLTLSGTGAGEIQGRLDLRGGRLQKRGPGVWTLNGVSRNIVWGADVLDGTLVLNGEFGRDITVHPGGTLAGTGRVQRNLHVMDGGALSLDPAAGPMSVGKNLLLGQGAKLALPPKIANTSFEPVLLVAGKIEGVFTDVPANARVLYHELGGMSAVSVQRKSIGTLLMVR
jgi:hypothetical protein